MTTRPGTIFRAPNAMQCTWCSGNIAKGELAVYECRITYHLTGCAPQEYRDRHVSVSRRPSPMADHLMFPNQA